MNIVACYPWEIVLNIGLGASVDNILDNTGIYETAGEKGITKVSVTNG
jgi:hypothetical protein